MVLGIGRLDDLEVVGLGDGLQHRAGVVGAAVVQRRQHAPDLERAVGEAAHVVHGVEQLAHPAVRQRLALQRDEDAVGSGERGDGQHAQRRRAVEQHPVVVATTRAQVVEDDLEGLLAAGAGQQVGLGPGQLDGGRHQVDAVVGRDDHLGRVEALGEHVVDRQLEVLGVDPERERQARLRIEVDQEDRMPQLGQRGADRRDAGRLGDAALLVGDRETGGGGHRDHHAGPGRPLRVRHRACCEHAVGTRSAIDRPRDRRDRRHRPRLRPPARCPWARPGPGGPRRRAPRRRRRGAAGGVRRGRGGPRRGPGRP